MLQMGLLSASPGRRKRLDIVLEFLRAFADAVFTPAVGSACFQLGSTSSAWSR